MRVTVALRLEPNGETPDLDALELALQEPARPLFIGRKPCLPSAPLFAGFGDGDTALDALLAWPLAQSSDESDNLRLLWPDGEGADNVAANRQYMLTDQRNWVSGLHGGGRAVCEGVADSGKFHTPASAFPPSNKESQK